MLHEYISCKIASVWHDTQKESGTVMLKCNTKESFKKERFFLEERFFHKRKKRERRGVSLPLFFRSASAGRTAAGASHIFLHHFEAWPVPSVPQATEPS